MDTRLYLTVCSSTDRRSIMKRLMPLVAVGVVSLAALTGCGSVAQPAPAATTSAPPEVVTAPTWNNNTDPYKDWVILNPTDYYTSEQVSYMCSHADTAFYRIGTEPYGMPVAKSSDCANGR